MADCSTRWRDASVIEGAEDEPERSDARDAAAPGQRAPARARGLTCWICSHASSIVRCASSSCGKARVAIDLTQERQDRLSPLV